MIRIPRAESLFGGPIDGDAGRLIRQMIDAKVTEDDVVDWKRAMYGSEDKAKDELAKDVAAFANRLGGAIVIGVADDRGAASAPFAWRVTDADKRHIRSTVASRVAPLPEFDLVEAPDPEEADKSFLIVLVAPSPLAPHSVTRAGSEVTGYPARLGSQTRWLTETEVASAYRDRWTALRERTERVDEVAHSGQIWLGSALWLSISFTPAVAGRLSINDEALDTIDRWQRSRARQPSIWGDPVFTDLAARVGVRSLQVLSPHVHDERPASYRFLELHPDGSSFVALQLDPGPPERVDRDFDSDGTAKPVWLLRAAVYLVEALGVAAEYATEHCACWGDSIVELKIDAVGEPLAPLVVTYENTIGSQEPFRGSRRHRADVTTRTTVDLDDLMSPKGRVAAAARLVDDVVQTFGVAQNPYLLHSGALDPRRMPAREAAKAREWAIACEVPLAEEAE